MTKTVSRQYNMYRDTCQCAHAVGSASNAAQLINNIISQGPATVLLAWHPGRKYQGHQSRQYNIPCYASMKPDSH